MTGVATEFVVSVGGILVATAVTAVWVGMYRLLLLVRDIKKEVLPNGGSSLRDAVNRIERKQKKADQKLDAHLASCSLAEMA